MKKCVIRGASAAHNGRSWRSFRSRRENANILLEALEPRQLLSISAQAMVGTLTPGTTLNYQITVENTTISGTETLVVIGNATAPTGQSAIEEDGTFFGNGSSLTDKRYYGFTAQGFVEFGDTEGKSSTTYTPPKVLYPQQAFGGQEYDGATNIRDQLTDNQGNISNSTTNETTQSILVSETLQNITLPAGTFNAYEFLITTKHSDGVDSGNDSTDTEDTWVVPGIGIVKSTIESNSGITDYVLSNLVATTDTLSFSPQPTGTTAGHTLPAFSVDFLDSSKQVDTNATGDVTLTLNRVNGTVGTLVGTKTVSAADGVATFDDLSIDAAGSFTLTASSIDALGDITSAKFQIVSDHLVFTMQPASTDVNAPILFKVAAETPTNKIDTSINDRVQMSLNVISGGQNATLGGTTLLSFVNGVATFTSSQAIVIAVPGTYTLTATAVDNALAPVASISAATAKPFIINPLHLVFTQQPRTADFDQPVTFKVSLVNSKNKVVTNASGMVTLALNGSASALALGLSSAAATPPALEGITTVALQNGVALFTPGQGAKFNEVGTYTLVASEQVDDGLGGQEAAVGTIPAISKSIKVNPLKLVFIQRVPTVNDVDIPIEFAVEIRDSKGKVVTDSTSDVLGLESVNYPKGKPVPDQTYNAAHFVNGVATFTKDSVLTIEPPGTYQLEVAAFADNPDTSPPDPNYTIATSAGFRVDGYHLSFLTQPPVRGVAGQPINFRLSLDNSRFEAVTAGPAADDWIGIASVTFETGKPQPTYQWTYSLLINDVATFGDDGFPYIEQSGKYEVEIAAFKDDNGHPGELDPFVRSVTSHGFILSAAPVAGTNSLAQPSTQNTALVAAPSAIVSRNTSRNSAIVEGGHPDPVAAIDEQASFSTHLDAPLDPSPTRTIGISLLSWHFKGLRAVPVSLSRSISPALAFSTAKPRRALAASKLHSLFKLPGSSLSPEAFAIIEVYFADAAPPR